MTALAAPSRPHAHQPRPGDPWHCTCGRTRAYRIHQPLWWRVLHPGARWR